MWSFAFIFTLLIFTRTKISLKNLFMVAGLIYLTFMSRRQASLFVLIVFPIVTKWVVDLFKRYDKNGTKDFSALMVTWIGKLLTLTFIIICSVVIIKPKLESKFVSTKEYPVEASTWILENLDISNVKLYNEYNYGSYLLFRGIPVFIDSRADLYAPEFNKTKDQDGRNIFSDYISISSIGTYYEDKFKKYEITHVIVHRNAKLNMFLSRNDKYKELYKDDNFVIYERNESNS